MALATIAKKLMLHLQPCQKKLSERMRSQSKSVNKPLIVYLAWGCREVSGFETNTKPCLAEKTMILSCELLFTSKKEVSPFCAQQGRFSFI